MIRMSDQDTMELLGQVARVAPKEMWVELGHDCVCMLGKNAHLHELHLTEYSDDAGACFAMLDAIEEAGWLWILDNTGHSGTPTYRVTMINRLLDITPPTVFGSTRAEAITRAFISAFDPDLKAR